MSHYHGTYAAPLGNRVPRRNERPIEDHHRMLTATGFARRTARRQRLLPWYVGTRVLMLLFTLNVLRYFNPGAIWGDVQLYLQWINGSFRHGSYPLDSLKWQYPPGAATPLLAPKLFSNALIPGSYYVAFYAMCLLADVLIFRMLLKVSRAASSDRSSSDRPQPENPSLAGPWAWTLGLFAIGPMVYGRYDLVVTAFAVGALCVSVKSDKATSVVRGVLIGVGTFVKLWPAAILFGVPRGQRGRTILGAAVLAAGVPTAVLAIAFPGVLSFVTHQEGRGIQVESIFATPFLVGHWFGWSGHVENSAYGAYEYVGPGVAVTGTLSLVATVVGFAAIVVWRWKARRRADATATATGGFGGFSVTMLADVALASTMVAMVTSRVLSPQYLIWALGLGAVCLSRRDSVQRTPSLIIMGAISVTQLIFPLFYHSLRGGQIFSGLLLLGRNAALVTATVMSLVALYHWARQGPEPDTGEDGEVDQAGEPDDHSDVPRQVSPALSRSHTGATSP